MAVLNVSVAAAAAAVVRKINARYDLDRITYKWNQELNETINQIDAKYSEKDAFDKTIEIVESPNSTAYSKSKREGEKKKTQKKALEM